jgi:hypothetical protein
MNPAVLASLIAFVLALPPAFDAWLAKKVLDQVKLAALVMFVGAFDAGVGAGLTQIADGSTWKSAAAVALASILSGLAVGIRRMTGGGSSGSGGSSGGDSSSSSSSASSPPAVGRMQEWQHKGFIGLAFFAFAAFLIGCAAFRKDAKTVLDQEPMACALATELTDSATVAAFCKVADADLPLLEDLLAGKAAGKAASAAKDGGADQ